MASGQGQTLNPAPGPSAEGTAQTAATEALVAPPSSKCWLCQDLGGLAVHRKGTKRFKQLLFTPHEVPSGSHETAFCPACEARDLREILANGVANALGQWMIVEASNVPTGFVPPTKGASP
jgi:hypothetical protein